MRGGGVTQPPPCAVNDKGSQMSKYCYHNWRFEDIENSKLRELVSKGPKHRGPNKINWKATENMIFQSIDLYAERWAKREQENLKYLSKWKETLKELQGGHKPGKHGKPAKLRELEKLSKSQGKLREI